VVEAFLSAITPQVSKEIVSAAEITPEPDVETSAEAISAAK